MLTFTNKETEEFEFDKCFIDGDSMLYRKILHNDLILLEQDLLQQEERKS